MGSSRDPALDPQPPVLTGGAPLARARAALVLVHGRGARAEDILALAGELDGRGAVAFLAPAAPGHTWYPRGFLAPLADNEPHLSAALATLDAVVARVAAAGIPPERTLLLGFSQGACLATEWAARHARRWGGVAALTGGLIGPAGTPRDYAGHFGGTPVFLGAGDPDAHVPWWRVAESAAVLERLGAAVTLRRYPGLPHTVARDELDAVQALLDGALAGAKPE